MADQARPRLQDLMGSSAQAAEGGAPPARKANRRKRLVPYGLAAPSVLWLLVFFLIPTLYMAFISLGSGFLGNIKFGTNFSNYVEVLKTYDKQFIRSVIYALIVTFLALCIAYPLAYWIALYGGRRKNVFILLILLPFFVSFVIRTVQWQFILADTGIIFGPLKNLGLLSKNFHVLSTPVAVIAGITYNFLPFTVLPLYVALERLDPRLLEAGRDLYANKVTTFLKVVWPLSLPGVFAAFLLTFVPAVGDFVNSQILGGPKTTMIGQIIQTLFQTNFDYPHGAALSFILMAFLLIGASLYAKVLGTEAVTSAAAR
ncbi:MAG: ABC transporter permease [Actinomycetota bacterium]